MTHTQLHTLQIIAKLAPCSADQVAQVRRVTYQSAREVILNLKRDGFALASQLGWDVTPAGAVELKRNDP